MDGETYGERTVLSATNFAAQGLRRFIEKKASVLSMPVFSEEVCE